MKITPEQKERITTVLDSANLANDYLYFIDDESNESETIDELVEYIDEQSNGYQVDVIYHYNAMQYLLENDQSLQYSLEIAKNSGFEIDNINSELLASLLATENERENFYAIKDDLEAILFPN